MHVSATAIEGLLQEHLTAEVKTGAIFDTIGGVLIEGATPSCTVRRLPTTTAEVWMAIPTSFLVASVLAFAASSREAENPQGNPRFQEVTSSDGLWIAYVNAEDGDSEIYVEHADRTQHIAFASDRSGTWQIHRMDADGGNVTQLTHRKSGCVKPKYGAKGQLAYLVHNGRAFKRELFDLIVSEGDRAVPVQQKIPIWDFAWHPDGELIACATDGQLLLSDLRQGTTSVVPLTDADPRLDTYSLFELRWSNDDQRFVGRLRFLGGVPQGTEVFGDGQLLLIPIEGRPWFVTTLDQ
jgi:hypothetical protein